MNEKMNFYSMAIHRGEKYCFDRRPEVQINPIKLELYSVREYREKSPPLVS